jgi:hypothetical protein
MEDMGEGQRRVCSAGLAACRLQLSVRTLQANRMSNPKSTHQSHRFHESGPSLALEREESPNESGTHRATLNRKLQTANPNPAPGRS